MEECSITVWHEEQTPKVESIKTHSVFTDHRKETAGAVSSLCLLTVT